MFMFAVLLFVAISNAYDKSLLNEFSADVDIYHMGMMGRGKNAGSWNRSLKNKQEVFYYLAMQPWRHLVWTDCTGTECFKYFINEDASSIPNKDGKTKLSNSDPNQDYCRKEYANPMATFDIDWNQIDPNGRLEAVDINGQTCYKYPAQQPLAHIFLRQQYLKEKEVTAMTPCRYDFIGGKSITFRSFNDFSPVFITDDKTNGYLVNKTRCNIDPSPNNVDTDIALILGISDASIDQEINGALGKLGDLKTVKQVTVYYLSGESYKKETIALKDLGSLKSKQITKGSVDALINTAKNDLTKRVNAKAIYRGTIIALMDRTLASTFDAETAFDRNNITVHTIVYNPKGDNQMRIRARSLVSVGEHYHEFTSANGISSIVNEMYIGVRANLTERCNRTSCDGFCDGRDRCTCPMCCENTCFFSYCNVTTATCKAWPEAKPKAKITCNSDCVGKQECLDLQGCVYTEYNPGCEPRAKCMKPYCEGNQCEQKSNCESDKTPSFENKCWSYKCNEKNGNCERDESGAECPKLPDLCHEHVCDSKLKCTYQKKTCVKTSPYVEMECYKAECNKRTGMCENVLSCGGALASYTGCGGKAENAFCKCNSEDYTCSCTGSIDQAKKEGFCSAEEICDTSDESKGPHCKKSNCFQDLYIEGCQIKRCNEDTGEIYWDDYDCKKNITFDFKDDNARKYCDDKFVAYCDGGECYAQLNETKSLEGGCGICSLGDPVISKDKYTKTYPITYEEDCSYLEITCPNGKPIPGFDKLINKNNNPLKDKDGNILPGKCLQVKAENGDLTDNWECQYNYAENANFDGFDVCSECYATASCYKNKNFRQYTYDKETGTCSMEVNYENQPECSSCNDAKDQFVEFCKNEKLDRTWSTEVDSKTLDFKYTIPKLCYPGEQCIPDPDFDCTDMTNGEIRMIYEVLSTCADGSIEAEYHYSKLWDVNRYLDERGQTEDFLKEVEEKAYCTWSFKMDSCKYCTVDIDNNKPVTPQEGEERGKYQTQLNDKCDDMKAEFKEQGKDKAFTFKCNKETDECEATIIPTICEPKDCFYYFQNDNGQCENTNVGTCGTHETTRDNKDAKFEERYNFVRNQLENKDIYDYYPSIVCPTTITCSEVDQITCTYEEFDTECQKAYDDYMSGARDFGCRKPVAQCNMTDLHCSFVELNLTNPAEDARFFYERDNVVFNDLCYQYTCQEFYNETTKSLEHHWVQTPESLAELNKKPETICDTVKCNPLSGKSESERRQCNPVDDYGLTETMAMCFQCACSMMTGENVLTMRANTFENTYELDACGNCVVKDRATGQQVNEVIPCVLAQPVNLTGAIAGATVAASVVFGLIGSMVVVSIGAFQTYQLVSSAMKNVISTTLENPEFVAADNEATNVLNNE